MGTFCSRTCVTTYKKAYYLGEGNPNYRGKQYDDEGYRIHHYPKVGRMKEHHYVVFTVLGITQIPKGFAVHHKDCNIYNNVPENLVVLSGSDHRWLHAQFGNATLWAHSQGKVDTKTLADWSNNPLKAEQLLDLNILQQSGVFKQGELLENPTNSIEDNQQPSLSSNAFEGSTTNSQIPPGNAEDGNADTSALPLSSFSQTVVDSNGKLKKLSKVMI